MLKKIVGLQVELKPKVPKENEKLCDTCGGIGWMFNEGIGTINVCHKCYSGIIPLCPLCKQPQKGFCMNPDCRKQWNVEEEQKLLNKAIEARYEDVPSKSKEMMYSDIYGYNEGYFTDIEDLVEYCNDNDISVPPYAWSTERITLSMEAGNILESACENLHDDAINNISGEKELQEFLDAWCAKQTGTDTYIVDYKYAIKVNEKIN